MAKLCVYITHGGLPAIKGAAKSYAIKDPSEEQVIAQYSAGKLKILPITGQSPGLDLDDFLASLKEKSVFRLCCDANLGATAAPQVMGEEQITDILVRSLKPEELLLFSENPLCLTDAMDNYLPTLYNSSVRRAVAVERAQLKAAIDKEIPEILLKANVEHNSNRADTPDSHSDSSMLETAEHSSHHESCEEKDLEQAIDAVTPASQKQDYMRQFLNVLRAPFISTTNKVADGKAPEEDQLPTEDVRIKPK